MGIFDKFLGGPKIEDIKNAGEQQGEVTAPFEDGSDSADGDELPINASVSEVVLNESPEIRQDKPEGEGQL
ncbi:MAG: hypothetical protein WC827_02640 [Candidatus Paceibacterota bacterium]|jgi:hypothetical protein